MNKFIVAFLGLVLVVSSCATSNDYLSKSFATARQSHKKIAVLPFKVRFQRPADDRQTPQRSEKFYTDQEFQASLDSQREMFLQLARQVKKGKFEMAIQDFVTTNKILDQNQIVVETLTESKMSSLANVLGVDAIILGNMYVNVTPINPYSMMPPNRFRDGIEATVNLYDGSTGEMLWNSTLSQRPSTPTDTPHRIASTLLGSMARSIPYRK